MLSGRLFSILYREELAVPFLQNARFGLRSAGIFRELALLFPALWLKPCDILFGFQEKAFRFRHAKFPSGRSSRMPALPSL